MNMNTVYATYRVDLHCTSCDFTELADGTATVKVTTDWSVDLDSDQPPALEALCPECQ